MALSASRECPCQSVISPVTRSGSRDGRAFVGLPRNFLFVRSGSYSIASRFHDVDSAGCIKIGSGLRFGISGLKLLIASQLD